MTCTVHTEAFRASLETLHAGIVQAAGLALRAAEGAAEADAKATTLFRDRTGDTRRSIRGQVFGMAGRLEVRGAGKLLEYGTVAHVIAPKRASALRFVVNGTAIFRRLVHHPGTKPRPFMHIARDRGQLVADYAIEEYANYAIQRA